MYPSDTDTYSHIGVPSTIYTDITVHIIVYLTLVAPCASPNNSNNSTSTTTTAVTTSAIFFTQKAHELQNTKLLTLARYARFLLKASSRTEKEQSAVSPPRFSVYSRHSARPATFHAKPHLATSFRDIAYSYTTWYTAQASLKRSDRSLGLCSNSSALYSSCRIP